MTPYHVLKRAYERVRGSYFASTLFLPFFNMKK